MRLILASASPARLATLRSAGLDPEVVVSGVDESGVSATSPAALTAELARRKGEAVAAAVADPDALIVACDSMFELDGLAYGKPADATVARERIRSMGGRSGVLHTGHHVIRRLAGQTAVRSAVGSTTVWFADLSEAEVEAYVASGEPLAVAGSFTIDGLGGAFVTRIEGDHHNVVGISLPLLRTVLADLGVSWTSLWSARRDADGRR